MHPASFFKFVSLIFKESQFERNALVKKFRQYDWFNESGVIVSGFSKLDGLLEHATLTGNAWKRGTQDEVQRILWTPRWTTSEGICHFFDYKDVLASFCSEHHEVDFVLRPHPLCFQNFVDSGEMSEPEIVRMENEYRESPNMVIDKAGDYQDTFLTSSILVSDLSSMILEYLATGRPIVYTHRIDLFNDLGNELAKGVYWVRNSTELCETLEMLLQGEDPLHEKRQELIESILVSPSGGAALRVKERITIDFHSAAIS